MGRQWRALRRFLPPACCACPASRVSKHVDVIRHPVPAGAHAIVATAGGGGWGDPLERDPEKVRWDVLEEYVSLERCPAELRRGVASGNFGG